MGADNASERVIAKMVAAGRMKPREVKVLLIRGSEVTALYGDELRELGGTLHVERASDVEWDNDEQGWIARIRPSRHDDAICLGPFATREEALAAEVAYIQARL